MALEQFKTQVLLLHSEQSTLDKLSVGFADRYTVHCATSGSEALNTLVETPMAQRAAQNDEIRQYIFTKQPLDGGRIGTATDLDAAVVYFLSDQSRFVTGQVLAVDGGWSVTEGQHPH